MAWSSVLAIAAPIGLIGFIVFAFREGEKVKNRAEGTPFNHAAGYGAGDHGGPSDQGGGHSL
jgi:hypothetical protein